MLKLRSKTANSSNIQRKSGTNSIKSAVMFIVILLAVIGGYAIYKGAVAFSVDKGRPAIKFGNYDDSKPMQKAREAYNNVKENAKELINKW